MLYLEYSFYPTFQHKMHGCQPEVSSRTNGYNNNNICKNGFEQMKIKPEDVKK